MMKINKPTIIKLASTNQKYSEIFFDSIGLNHRKYFGYCLIIIVNDKFVLEN